MEKLSSDEYKIVLAFFEKALENEPEQLSYWFDIGFCQGRLGQWEDAAKALEKVVESQPPDPHTLALLGHAYIKVKLYDNALDVLHQALKLRPKSRTLLYKLASAHFGKGELGTAKSLLQEILKISPNHGKAHFGIGLICYYLDDLPGYQKQLSVLKDLTPELSTKLSSLEKTDPERSIGGSIKEKRSTKENDSALNS